MKIGIDLGGTKTEGILIDNKGKELTRKRISTEKNYEGTLKGISKIVREFEKIGIKAWGTAERFIAEGFGGQAGVKRGQG